MQSQKFFVPVNSVSLAHYFGRAIILPSTLYTNRPADIQDRFKNSILLSKHKWAGGADCSVEIWLTDAELSNLTEASRNANLLLYAGGIPISRVGAVYFKDKSQSEITQWNINNGTAYLPTRLISVEEPASIDNQEVELTEEPTVPEDFNEKVRRFDILLGSVSFLNVAKSKNAPFAKDYFAVVGYFNNFIRTEYLARVDAGVATYDSRLTGLYKRENGWKDILPLVTEEVEDETVEIEAKKENIRLERKYGLIDIERIPKSSHTYILALLATYGLNKQKGIPDLVGSVISLERDEQKAEEIAAIFGLHLRYSNLRNAYMGKSAVKTKFQLETRLDYYVIESVFQFSFNKEISSTLDYIDRLLPQNEGTREPIVNGFRILDVVIPISKPNIEEKQPMEPTKPKYYGGGSPATQTQNDMMPKIEEAINRSFEIMKRDFIASIGKLEHEIMELRKEVRIISKMPAEGTLNVSVSNEANEKTTSSDSEQEMEKMQLTQLKEIAKELKISPKAYSGIKPTKQGLEKMISLINKQKKLF